MTKETLSATTIAGRLGTVASSTRGRSRFRLRPELRNAAEAREIVEVLQKRPGVHDVSVNERTGSIVVSYDEQETTEEEVWGDLKEVGSIGEALFELEGEEELGGTSGPAQRIADAVEDLDQRIYEQTGGRLHIGVLVPAGLAAMGVRQLVVHGLQLEFLPGPVLLWLAWDTSRRMRRDRKPSGASTEDVAGMEGVVVEGTDTVDLTSIEGVGPAPKQEPAGHGVKTTAQLAMADPEEIPEVVGVTESTAVDGVQQADRPVD